MLLLSLFFAAVMRGGGCLMFFRLCLCFCLCLCLCLCLYLYPCFCFCFSLSVSVSVSVLIPDFILICRCREFFFAGKRLFGSRLICQGEARSSGFVFFTRIFRHRSGAAQRPTVLCTESTVILRSRAVGCFFIIIFSRLFLDFSG